MIKVGQIYRLNEHCYAFAITRKSGVVWNTINSDGRSDYWDEDFINKIDLIAEYPTWQEAVNSKEFKE